MTRGISFEFPDNYNEHSYLFDIVTVFSDDVVWVVQDMLLYNWDNSTIRDTEQYDNHDFSVAVSELYAENTLDNCVLFGLATDLPYNVSKTCINNYADFLSSDFTIAILIYDCAYCEIYLKDLSLVSTIEDVAKKIGCTNIEITTDENDGRTVFHV